MNVRQDEREIVIQDHRTILRLERTSGPADILSVTVTPVDGSGHLELTKEAACSLGEFLLSWAKS